MKTWTNTMECNLVLPAPEIQVLYLDGSIYEILAPGTRATSADNELRIWRGLYQARNINQGLKN